MNSRPPREVRAAGAVLWRETPQELRIAVVHRPRYDDWSLPKGKLDPGETVPAAAVRELAEETGFRAILGRRLRTVRYPVSAGMKTVEYFSAQALDGSFRPNDEVDDLRWLSPEEAEALLSYEADVGVLRAFTALSASLSTLLLVRHAKAGKRSEWAGEDDLRPLSPAGRRQAEAVRKLAPLFGVDRVFSAPPSRCWETVEGAAADLGVEIGVEPLLSEDGYWPERARGLSRLLAIVSGRHGGPEACPQAGSGGRTPRRHRPLVCSQGGVIPDVVATLAERSGVELPMTADGRVPCKKGSVWVLSFHATGSDGRPVLAAADYYPTALPAPEPAHA